MENLVIPHRISRGFVQCKPDWLFIYSNDYLQRGCEGMAWHFASEPNTFMVPTMYKYCANPVYFQDCNYHDWIPKIIEALNCVPRDGRPIIPVRGIGNGCSRMKEFCPNLHKFLWFELNKIATPHTIDWNPQ